MGAKPEKSTFQVMMERIHQVLRATEEKQISKEKLEPGVKEQVAELEKMVGEWTDLSNILLKQLGYTPEEATALAAKPIPHLPEEDQRTFRYSHEVLQDARRKYTQAAMVLRAIKNRGEVNMRTGEKKVLGKSRQKKFRRVGGRGDWMPM